MKPEIFTNFYEYRVQKIRLLESHISRNLVDPELVQWLRSFNENTCLVTTSSCSGRITMHLGVDPLDKRNSLLIASWHDPAKAYRELCNNATYPLINKSIPKGSRIMWISLQPPIIHIVSPSLNLLSELLDIAVKAGMRRSCIRRSKHGWQLEVKSGDKSIYYFDLPPDCNIVRQVVKILSEYKDRFSSWMNNALVISKKYRYENS
ncbi:MAG: hypothetical protein GSR79_05230 [Desulfurococcales archaeon]|nr:hypothetical protein [Desulfurococcales archaeon]